MRLNKYLADSGIASRRKAELFILDGKVKINGKIITQLGTKVDPNLDIVEVDDQVVKPEAKKIVIMLNKPIGYVCTTRSFKGEKNVLDLVNSDFRLYPIGRLDKDSSGLILLTNDGDLALKLSHPRYEKEKEYEVEVHQELSSDFLESLKRGVILDDEKTLPVTVKQLTSKSFSIILKQGKKRQIRRMCGLFDYTVLKLKRVRINNLELGDLESGNNVILDQNIINKLLA
ncbi:rRNA pseudouridine synthase [Candidatus Falkowbacteria bacterium]|nr:rRNA pseudouridine synthase [Candidatus Falkowbacteria bacterium]MBT6574260.1 rRNA pseudouridine synthase [Candidatus Falkowbacteria bacterium]MBT7348164.1 rRNA pseudouridine synthase [Candidatus Falkowbacteria bacterium]MBT7500775.1 rRNA pseudouridine synthase [Candidatus Falkowbacteria bacterium]